ncbi:MAG: hypothetical protein AAF806_08730 [Bacteroidota bacterium]
MMKFVNKTKNALPELFFIGLGVYWFLETSIGKDHTNYLALTTIALFAVQLFWKNRFLGITLSVVLFCLMAYMSLALLSEFSEFEQYTKAAWTLLIVGGSIVLSGLLMSVLLLRKNIRLVRSIRN